MQDIGSETVLVVCSDANLADDLLQRLGNRHYPLLRETAENANFLAKANWPWARPVMQALLKAIAAKASKGG